mgnify:CR=1 FL=1
MGKELVPFWEDTYRDNSVSTFAITPNPTVKEFEHLLNLHSQILEVGCGSGFGRYCSICNWSCER